MRSHPLLLALALMLSGCARELKPSAEMTHESTVYLARTVRTSNAAQPVVRGQGEDDAAVWIFGGKVKAVGRSEEVLRKAGVARVVRLPGATIVPGFQDAHGHLSSLGQSLSEVDLRGARSVDEVVARLRGASAKVRQGDWLLGRGWDQNDWPDKAFPTRGALDAALPGVPVLLERVDGHAYWASGEALRRAGIDAKTPDPEGGRYLRDEKGAPSGVAVDNAMTALDKAVPEPSDEQLAERLRRALMRVAQAGITVVHDAGMDLRTFSLLQQWDLGGLLPIRVYAMAAGQGSDAQAYLDRGPYKGRLLEMRGVKFLLDGALGSRGAALFEDYADDPGNKGLLLITPEALEEKSEAFMRRGFQVCVHAIGDRANALVLDALEKAIAATGTSGGRHRLEHAQVLRVEDIPRVAKLGVVASMQPTHATSDMRWAEARLGPKRILGAYAWRSFLNAGVHLAFGSDFPVEEPDVLPGIYAARTRQDASGKPAGGWYPDQRVSGEEALAGFTTGAAYASFAEDVRGKLVEGMDGDLIALSVDPVEDPPQALLSARVLLTVVAGQTVFSAEENPLDRVSPSAK